MLDDPLTIHNLCDFLCDIVASYSVLHVGPDLMYLVGKVTRPGKDETTKLHS